MLHRRFVGTGGVPYLACDAPISPSTSVDHWSDRIDCPECMRLRDMQKDVLAQNSRVLAAPAAPSTEAPPKSIEPASEPWMLVVETDNYGGDYPDESFHGPTMPKAVAEAVAAIEARRCS